MPDRGCWQTYFAGFRGNFSCNLFATCVSVFIWKYSILSKYFFSIDELERSIEKQLEYNKEHTQQTNICSKSIIETRCEICSKILPKIKATSLVSLLWNFN